MTRVLLVDDDTLARQKQRTILENAADIEVVGEADNAEQAMAKLRAHAPDVIVASLCAPGMEHIATRIRQHAGKAQVPHLVLTACSQSQDAARLLRTGARGYVGKRSAASDLLEAIRAVMRGNRYVSAQLKPILEQAAVQEHNLPEHLGHLTPRELQILKLLAVGKTNRETAETLNLSRKTISTHRTLILAKLGLRNNVELAHFAIEHSLLNG